VVSLRRAPTRAGAEGGITVESAGIRVGKAERRRRRVAILLAGQGR